MSETRRCPHPRAAARHHMAALALAVALAACGGGTLPARSDTAAAPQDVTSLFDERGQPRLSSLHLVPADTAARTRSGLYATRAQFEWEELIAAPYTVLIDVDQMGVAGAVLLAEQVRGLRDTRGLAFFVRAGDPVIAAQVVNTLADAGFAPVFMVV
jgi:hypothetical protein